MGTLGGLGIASMAVGVQSDFGPLVGLGGLLVGVGLVVGGAMSFGAGRPRLRWTPRPP